MTGKNNTHGELISAIILAGGEGRRVQHQDKGLLQWRGHPLVQHCIDRVKSQVGDIVLSCNRNLTAYQRLGYPVVQDRLAHYQGPLAGIHAALPVCKASYIFTCPCDSPLLPADVVAQLWNALQHNNIDIAIAHDGQQAQSLVMVLRRRCATDIESYLESGARSVHGWQQRHSTCYVDFSHRREAFANLNYQSELKS